MLFSIITVCFNSAKTIRQTFDSILQQQCKDYEYIVVDGASTDGTVDIIKEYEPKFEGRMRWISEPDDGIYYAMNKGIKLSKGEYLNFLNADDYYEPDALEFIQREIVAHPGFDVYYGIVRCYDEDGEVCLSRESHIRLPYRRICHQAMWYRHDVFVSFGEYDTRFRMCADFHHQIGLLRKNYSFLPIDHIVVNYFNNGFSSYNKGGDILRKEDREIFFEYGYLKKREYLQQVRAEKRHERYVAVKIFLHRILLVKYIKPRLQTMYKHCFKIR